MIAPRTPLHARPCRPAPNPGKLVVTNDVHYLRYIPGLLDPLPDPMFEGCPAGFPCKALSPHDQTPSPYTDYDTSASSLVTGAGSGANPWAGVGWGGGGMAKEAV